MAASDNADLAPARIRVLPADLDGGPSDTLLLEIRISPRAPQTALHPEVTTAAVPILVRVEEAARMLAISRAALYPLLGREIPIVRIGRSVRIPAQALNDYVLARAECA